MLISEANASSKPLDVTFDSGSVLHIEYLPPSYTIEQIERAQADKNNPSRIIELVREIVLTWDLAVEKRNEANEIVHDDGGRPIEEIVSLDDTDALKRIPIHIFNTIIRTVREDNTPSGEA